MKCARMLLGSLVGIFVLGVAPLFAAQEDLMSKSLEDLLNTPLAMLTQSSKGSYIPASVTTITEEQIEMTPARNIYDLMEIYVPGAFWVTHSESPHVGVRGIISDRNYKMLVLVNGRKLNQNAHSGAEAELEQWDLHDIKKIEVIRGPGSVTYGPGAIECVINITTKGAEDAPGVRAGTQYVTKYDSKGVYFSDGIVKKDSNFYMYGSVVSTNGFSPKEFYTSADNKTGYLGRDASLGDREPLDYFNDANDIPQVKLYSEYNSGNELKVWARYTNSGSARHGSLLNTKSIMDDGGQVDLKENKDQMFVTTVENKHEFSDVMRLDSMISLSSIDHQRRDNVALSSSNLDPNVAADGSDVDSMRNIIQAFSETELLVRSLLNYTAAEKYKFAVGFENSYEKFGPGWGDSKDEFRMGDASNMLGSASSAANNSSATANAVAVSSPYIIGGGWYADTLSWLAEANLEFDPKFNLILSGRTDQNSYTRLMFSPRVALVSDWEKMGVTKFIAQKSVRMNTAEQLYLTNETGGKNITETLTGYEFIYDVSPVRDLFLESSISYNGVDLLGWSNASASTVALGTAHIFTFELYSKYKCNERLTVGASQSYTKLVKFELGSGQTRSGISYSDYNITTSYPGVALHYTGTGDNLSNWPNLATKIYTDYRMTPKWTLHADARVFWGFEGELDGLEMIENAAQGTADQAAIDSAINDIRSHRAYKADARLDASARYALNKNTTITFLVWNLLGLNDNKRYTYDAGVNVAAPNRATWIEEPRVYGVKVDCKF